MRRCRGPHGDVTSAPRMISDILRIALTVDSLGKERREPKKKQSQGWTQREASAQHCRRRPPARKHLLDLRASFTLAARSIARPTPGPRRGGRVAIPPPKRMKRVVRKRVRGKFWGAPLTHASNESGSSLRRRRQGFRAFLATL